MKVLLFVFFAALLTTAHCLDCYQCNDCADIGDKKAETCIEKTTTSPTETTTLEDTTTEAVETTTEVETPLPQTMFRHRRAASPAAWYCYEAQYTENDAHKISRGCVFFASENNKCPADLEQTLPGKMGICKICQNDGCNNGSAVAKLSLLAFCIIFITKFVL